MNKKKPSSSYHRYHIQTKQAPDIEPWPNRFLVKVNKPQLALYLLKELIDLRGDFKAVFNRPCMYGVFSGPVGGFAPRPQYCVGCLRCTTQHAQVVQIYPNPKRQQLGDSFFHGSFVDTIAYEASTGAVPVKGAGYRGIFGGAGWDGMWTDMSEIVRPTRDGIHGREFISTKVDIGSKPPFLVIDERGKITNNHLPVTSIPIPILLDILPAALETGPIYSILAQAAAALQTYTIIPIKTIPENALHQPSVIPLIPSGEKSFDLVRQLEYQPAIIEMDGWDESLFSFLRERFPHAVLILRSPFLETQEYIDYYQHGIHTFHLTANYHGQTGSNTFIMDAIRHAHQTFVTNKIRDQVTLIGSGGIIAAEHIPKAIILGLDLVALDTPILVALQAIFNGKCNDRTSSQFHIPENLTAEWGVQRISNLVAAWHDQLLEILGAMGIREVRRLRGEVGRAMFQSDLEKEAFTGIDGYEN